MAADRIKLLTFDLDDTLWEFAPVLQRAEIVSYAWLQRHAPAVTDLFSMEELRDLRFQIAHEKPELSHRVTELRKAQLRHAMALAKIDARRIETLTADAFAVFLQARHEVELFEAAETVLDELRNRYMLAVITNGNFNIRTAGLDRYFAFAVNAEQLARAKPHPEPFEEALRLSGCRADQCIHIGDDIESDMHGAQRAGFATIWLNMERRPWPGGEPPSREIRHLQELPDAVDGVARS